jgi:hypothetical protein
MRGHSVQADEISVQVDEMCAMHSGILIVALAASRGFIMLSSSSSSTVVVSVFSPHAGTYVRLHSVLTHHRVRTTTTAAVTVTHQHMT